MKKNIITIIILIFLLLFQIAFLNNINFFLFKFNCILIAFVLMLNIFSFSKVIAMSVLCGFIMDIFSNMPFGTFLVTYTLTIFITEILFLNFFTNHSLYSIIILGVMMVVLFNMIFLGISGIMYFLNVGNFTLSPKFWMDFLWQIVDNSIVLAICFYFIYNKSRLFKPVFLKS